MLSPKRIDGTIVAVRLLQDGGKPCPLAFTVAKKSTNMQTRVLKLVQHVDICVPRVDQVECECCHSALDYRVEDGAAAIIFRFCRQFACCEHGLHVAARIPVPLPQLPYERVDLARKLQSS